jgi:hypothetical protein
VQEQAEQRDRRHRDTQRRPRRQAVAEVYPADGQDQVTLAAELVVDERSPNRHRPLGDVDDPGAPIGGDQGHRDRGIGGAGAEPDDQEQEVFAHRSSRR